MKDLSSSEILMSISSDEKPGRFIKFSALVPNISLLPEHNLPLQSDEQLRIAAMQAGELLQDIQNYAERGLRDDAKVSFPRGLMRTAEEYRQECPDYLTQMQKSSCAYGFMYLDVLWWLSSRTDITGIAKEMIFKSAIITLGTITEAVLHIPNEGIFDSNAGVRPRLDKAAERGWINESDCATLKTLWENRNNVHLRLLDTSEFNKYKKEHVNEPSASLKNLMRELKNWQEAKA
jgi:hypothetical protein